MKHRVKFGGLSRTYWAAVGMTVLLCALSRFQGDTAYTGMISLQAFFLYSREELLRMGEYGCAYMTAVGFRDTDWFCIALPLLVSLPGIHDFAGQWMGGNYYLNVSRSTRKRYAMKWLWRAAWQGFCVVVMGIVLYTGMVYLKFPCYHEVTLEAGAGMIDMAYGATDFARWIFFIKAVLHTGLLSAITAMCAVVLVAVMKDSFLSVSFLILGEYVSMKLELAYGVLIVLKYGDGEIPLKIRLLQFLMPTRHLYFDRMFQTFFHVGYWFYLVLAGVAVLMIISVFIWLVRRRSE